MTKKQCEVKKLMKAMVSLDYGTYYTNNIVEVYKAKKDGYIAYLVIKPEEFKLYKSNGNEKLKLLGKKSYQQFEDTVGRIRHRYEVEIADEKYYEEYRKKVQANLDNPKTFKNDYLEELLEQYRNKRCSWALNTILSSYENGRVNGNEEFIIDDIRGCSNDSETIQEIDSILTKAGIKEFVYTETSSAAMLIINLFMNLGWKVKTNYQKTIKSDSLFSYDKQIIGLIFTKGAE